MQTHAQYAQNEYSHNFNYMYTSRKWMINPERVLGEGVVRTRRPASLSYIHACLFDALNLATTVNFILICGNKSQLIFITLLLLLYVSKEAQQCLSLALLSMHNCIPTSMANLNSMQG